MDSQFWLLTFEDAVKAGLAGTAAAEAGQLSGVTHAPVAPLFGFVAAFLASIILSLGSKPFGNALSNHVLGIVSPEAVAALSAIVSSVATLGVPSGVPTPQAGSSDLPGGPTVLPAANVTVAGADAIGVPLIGPPAA